MRPPAATDPPRAQRWRTWANAVTALRLGSAPLLALLILERRVVAAALVFGLAVITDLADGRLARARREASNLGGLLDHLADATFVAAGLAALARLGVLPWLLPPLLVLAFCQYVLDSRATRDRALRRSRLGRWNGIAYYVLLGVPLLRDGLALRWPDPWLVRALGWVLVASTLASIAGRGAAWARSRC